MIRNSIVTLAALTVVFAALNLNAGERVTKKTPKPFSVCAGSCSRSMDVVSRHETAWEAIRVAQQLREEERYVHVGVAKGEKVKPLDMHASFRPNAKPTSASVYAHGCKFCELRGTLVNVADADAVAKRITDDSGLAEVIFNYEATTR